MDFYFCFQTEANEEENGSFRKLSCILWLPGVWGLVRAGGVELLESGSKGALQRSTRSCICGNNQTDDSDGFLLCHGKGF